MKDWFEISGNVGSNYWNHDNGYEMQSLTADSSSVLGWLLDPTGTVAGLWNDLTGASSQSREFSQQEYLQDKQNEYNSPVNQMAREKAAGINLNTAAAGIAQGGNESAQAPAVASNTQGVAQGVASAAGAVAGLGALPAEVASLYAGAKQSEAAANETNTLLGIKGGLFRAQTYEALMNGGLSASNARAVEIENFYRGESLSLDIEAKRLNLPILRQTFTNLQKQYDVMVKDIERMDQEILESGSRISLNEANRLKALKEGRYIEAQTFYQDGINKIMQDFNYDPRWPSNSIMFGIAADTSISDEEAADRFDMVGSVLYSTAFKEAQGSSKGSEEVNKNLIKLHGKTEAFNTKLSQQRDFKQRLFDKWVRVPNSAKVGPFSMSTQ